MSHKLTSKQRKAIYLLAGGATTIEAGRQLKLRRETLSRWKKIPEFALEFERVMEQVRGDMHHRLTHLAGASISAVSYGVSSDYCDLKRLQTAFAVLKLLGIERVLSSGASSHKQEGHRKAIDTRLFSHRWPIVDDGGYDRNPPQNSSQDLVSVMGAALGAVSCF